MSDKDYALIGIDGGATKVSGWIVNISDDKKNYTLSSLHATEPYAALDGYITDFAPVPVPDQIAERDKGQSKISENEQKQGNIYIESAVKTIAALTGNKPVVIGIGMPGLKTADLRGINVIANGPRMISYCDQVEDKLKKMNIEMAAPITRLGSDADYCGIGELYAAEGAFKDTSNAYYLGGGTGAADALLLRGKLVPFDQIKPWMAKTWEMKNDQDLSLERYASASGIQYLYSIHSKISTGQLNAKKIYPPEIASLATKGDAAAIKIFDEIARYLALLIFDRITTLFCGSNNLFGFLNPNRKNLNPEHHYRSEVFDRIVIGQRLGDLMSSEVGQQVLTEPFLKNLSAIINTADCLPKEAQAHYCNGQNFKTDKLVFSNLREAPALGAGIDAHLAYCQTKQL